MSSPTVESMIETNAPDDTVRAVRSTIQQFFDAMNRQDLQQMKEITAHDPHMVHIGTDDGEIWRGWEHLHADTIEQFDGLQRYEATIRRLAIHTSKSGDTAWYSHLLDAKIESGTGMQVWEGARFTGVLEKRGGDWRLVQTHVSLPESHN